MKNNKNLVKNNEKSDKNASFLKKLLAYLSYTLFPDDIKCIFCGTDINHFYEKPYCESCEKKLPFLTGNLCEICSTRIPDEAKICDFCQKNKRYFKKIFAPFSYADVVRANILMYKNKNMRYLAKGYAIIMAKIINVEVDLVTYVPMTKASEKRRTFNQSALLAKEIAKILNVPCIATLEKVEETKEQKTLSFSERSDNLKNAFKLTNYRLIKDKTLLIVDDIITTCATINACCEKLSRHAKAVYVSAIARNDITDTIKRKEAHNLA